MHDLTRSAEPFRFFTRLHITELTGLRALTLGELHTLIGEVPESCIYHHTHRFLQQHQYLSPEPPNDFAYWVSEMLGESRLGERLASIDTIQYKNIEELREKIFATIEQYIREQPDAIRRFVYDEEAFYFLKSVSFILPTEFLAYDLKEFVSMMREITIDSIYYHIFEARMRLERRKNDFSHWMETSLGENALAEEIAELDPYTQALEDLRNTIIAKVERRLQS